MAANDGGPAFPRPMPGAQYRDEELGMTLRDWFAGMALQGVISLSTDDFDITNRDVASWSYALADAMLAERDADD